MTHTPEQIERTERLIRSLVAASDEYKPFTVPRGLGEAIQEARAIVATLPKPVDVDKESVRQIMKAYKWRLAGDDDTIWRDLRSSYGLALAALKRGRELEREAMSNSPTAKENQRKARNQLAEPFVVPNESEGVFVVEGRWHVGDQEILSSSEVVIDRDGNVMLRPRIAQPNYSNLGMSGIEDAEGRN